MGKVSSRDFIMSLYGPNSVWNPIGPIYLKEHKLIHFNLMAVMDGDTNIKSTYPIGPICPKEHKIELKIKQSKCI